ncbi:hypothetical protein [Nonomuraea sp. NPDC050643]|uniref:hypothetical protein n=1 Tax=Nonomuraea sp. NPDC050643 TaxID=3155660 RepID=UPI0033F95810
MIVDTDAKNEADGQFAIVHALLSPSLDIRGLVPALLLEPRIAERDVTVIWIGGYLVRRLVEWNELRHGGSIDFSVANRPIRTYDSIDARFVHEDFFAKPRAFASR